MRRPFPGRQLPRSAPRRLLVAAALLSGLVLLVALRDRVAGPGASQVLLLCALGLGAALWAGQRRRGARVDDWEEPTLEVRARTGLTPRCGVALIEADGQNFLVVHGEGFATVHGMVPPPALPKPSSRELLQ